VIHVPTLEELHKQGLAAPIAWTSGRTPKVTHWRITSAGQQLIYDAMHANALELRAADDEHRRNTPPKPPSRWDS
jgi:hypothetical protein